MPLVTPVAVIIGAGLMGHWHAAVAARAGARILAVVDTDLARAQALASRYRAAAFTNLRAMQAAWPTTTQSTVPPLVAHVCTPMHTHVAYCSELLAAGMHVLCEKPLAATAAEVEALLATAARHGRLLCPVHQFAFQAGVQRVKDGIARLGPITRVTFSFQSAGGGQRAGAALDEVVADIMPHAFSVLSRLWPAQDLAAMNWQTVRAAPGELAATTSAGDATVSMVFSLSSRPTEACLVLAGRQGSAHIDFFHGYAYWRGGEVSRRRKVLQPFASAMRTWLAASTNLAQRAWQREVAYPGLRNLVADFYGAVLAGHGAPLMAAEIVATYRARDELLRCAGWPA